ncbi:MAG: helix-turn-helix domain-containing protein [Myxococcota bacterium]
MKSLVTDPRTLGTLLRHLIELLDSGVQSAYDAADLDYRPRYTPVVRALRDLQPRSIAEIALAAGMTHSAVSQTVQHMHRQGLVRRVSGRDGRERRVTLSSRMKAMLPKLEARWKATNAAAASLDRELSASLHRIVREAISALEHRSFASRIDAQCEERSQ